MKIGIIGASFAGLIAGKKLAGAGHDVTVFEQQSRLGNRLATRRTANGFFDYGTPFIDPDGEEFQAFVDELEEKKILYKWTNHFLHFDGTQMHTEHPSSDREINICYAGHKGMNRIADYLKRWMDIKQPIRVGGLTHIGADRTRKRPWMINLTDISVFECDAVIIAADAANAHGILQTTQDEEAVRRIIHYVDDISYESAYTVMAACPEESPEWKGIECENSDIIWIGNDTSKKANKKGACLTIHSSEAFAKAHANADSKIITERLTEAASEITKMNSVFVDTELHFWKYFKAKNTINEYFIELEAEETPLALVGDYFKGTSPEAEYLSGYYLAEYWISKFEEVVV